MVSLGPGIKPKIETRYPHMMPEDFEIWTRFIRNGEYLPDECWYDVRVGRAWPMPDDAPQWMRRYCLMSTRKRIDIVWRVGQDYWVIELKPLAGTEALGQVIYYAEDFRREYAGTRRVMAAVVTDVVDQDVRPVFDLAGIVVFEVGQGGDARGR